MSTRRAVPSFHRWAASLLTVVLLVGLAGLVLPGQASAAAPASSTLGQFVAVPTTRVFDSGSVNVGATPVVVSVPATVAPRTATAVVVNTEVYAPTAAGYVRVTPAHAVAVVATQEFAKGQSISNLGTVKLADGQLQVSVSAGKARVLMDVSGYYTDEPAVPGSSVFNPLATTRVFDSGSTPVGTTPVPVPIAGHGGVPAGATAVVVNTEVYQPTAAGYVRVTPAGTDSTVATQEFARGQTVSNLVIAALHDGQLQVRVAAGSARVLMDVAGYYSAGGQSFVPLPTTRIYDSATPSVGTSPVQVPIAGHAGVPAGATGVVVNAEVYGPTSAGYLRVTPGGTDSVVATQEFAAGQSISNLVVVALSGGKLQLKVSAGHARILLDVAGYVAAPVSVPGGTTSRYVDSLSAIADSSSTGEGCTDAGTGPGLVLLQIGAQTIHAPLSAGNPGVLLVGTDNRYSYADLVTALDGYLAGFSACRLTGVTTAIALGTNNDGYVGSTYAPTAKGADWAHQVVDAVQSHPGIVIAGADDIESGWTDGGQPTGSTEAQAESWVSAYLSGTSADLINNGAAINCPDTFRSSADCGSVAGQQGPTWTRANYVRLSYGLGPGRISVLPQVYFSTAPDQATAWANIDLTSGSKLTFRGSLTQYGTGGSDPGLTPAAGWSALYAALAAIGAPTPPAVATDLRYG